MKNFLIQDDIDEIINSIKDEKDSFNNKNIVISGAFGFIGKYLLETLLKLKENLCDISHEDYQNRAISLTKSSAK